MSVYSVYDYSTRRYAYYEAPGPSGTHAKAPPIAPGSSMAAASPEAASWRLPFGATKIGEGDLPRGRVATTSFALGQSLGDLSDLPRVAVLIGIAYLAWRALR